VANRRAGENNFTRPAIGSSLACLGLVYIRPLCWTYTVPGTWTNRGHSSSFIPELKRTSLRSRGNCSTRRGRGSVDTSSSKRQQRLWRHGPSLCLSCLERTWRKKSGCSRLRRWPSSRAAGGCWCSTTSRQTRWRPAATDHRRGAAGAGSKDRGCHEGVVEAVHGEAQEPAAAHAAPYLRPLWSLLRVWVCLVTLFWILIVWKSWFFKNLLSEKSRCFINPEYFCWILRPRCKMICMPLRLVITHFHCFFYLIILSIIQIL
jgi:hypothetical protein